MVNTVNPIFLFNKMPRYGKHSGYEQLPSYVQALCPGTKTVIPQNSLTNRIIGKLYSLYRGWPGRNQPDAAAELALSMAWRTTTQSVAHILYAEYHLMYLEGWTKCPSNLIATIHEPPSRWQPSQIEQLRRLSSAIVLYQRDIQFFENLIGKGNVHYIAHGVDTEFFRPADTIDKHRILFAGVHLRNNSMLRRVLLRLAEKHSSLKFELVVNNIGRADKDIAALANHPSITWHHEISDNELRQLYQQCNLLLLPMKDSGANNSIVEALASGLPIATTDCGGIADYGGGSIYPVVDNDDDEKMIELVEQYLDRSDWRAEISRNCRQFAETKLAWPIAAQEHMRVYQSLNQLTTG